MSSIFDRFELASIKRMYDNAKAVHKYSHKPTLFILLDMSKCILKDHVGYMEYNLFHFVNKPQEKRDTYITFEYSQHLFKTLNDSEKIDIFNDKLAFNKVFKEYLKRDFIDPKQEGVEAFKKFCENKKVIFVKPADSCSGKGIYKNIYLDENSNIEDIYNYLVEHSLFAEDTIIQNEQMNKLSKHSINTIRVTTLLDSKNEAHVMYTLLRMGTGDMYIDNVASGGIYTVLSKDGKIINPAWSDKTISTYTVHPTTNTPLIGFEIPYFNEALELCKNAAKVENKVRYVGWDIAISDKGPLIVEGNPLPGYDMAQNYFASGTDIGLKPEFEKVLSI